MNATLPAADVFNGKNMHGEKLFTSAIVIVCRATGHEPVKATVWHSQSKGSNYATVWAHGKLQGANARHLSGHGRATGWDYHRPSAALGAAFDSAGIKLSDTIAGRGDRAMRDACIAVAVALGYDEAALVAVEV